MSSVLPISSGTIKGGYRQHRLVVLPDFQGLGIGTKLNDFIAKQYYNQNLKYFIRTTHVRLGQYLGNNNNWSPTSTNQKIRSVNRIEYSKNKNSCTIGDTRQAYSYEYVGEEYLTKKHQGIICIGDELDYETAKKYVLDVVNKDKFPIIITGIAKGTNNIFELVAKDLNIRTEVLYIKKNGEYRINASKLKSKFDLICFDKDSQVEIKKYRDNINNMITYNYKSNLIYKRLIKNN